jgi:hypothetical protein
VNVAFVVVHYLEIKTRDETIKNTCVGLAGALREWADHRPNCQNIGPEKIIEFQTKFVSLFSGCHDWSMQLASMMQSIPDVQFILSNLPIPYIPIEYTMFIDEVEKAIVEYGNLGYDYYGHLLVRHQLSYPNM